MSAPPLPAAAPARRAVPAFLRAPRAALVFLTRVPAGSFPICEEEMAWAPAHFPLVGAVLGAALGALDALLLPLGPLAAAALVLGASLLATGALHEDGLADTADALGGAADRGRVLEILKDSRVGAYGAAALAFSLLARAALIARLGPAAPLALPLALCAARAAPVWLLRALPYVSPQATSRSGSMARAGPLQALAATAWVALVAALTAALGGASLARALSAVVAAGLAALASGLRYRRRLGGVTGDLLGATEQLAEIAALAALAWGL